MTEDERANKPNPSKIKFDANVRNNLQSYKNAVILYRKFLTDAGFKSFPLREQAKGDSTILEGAASEEFNQQKQQRFSIERDMQTALRLNIASLDSWLKIIDDGAGRAVDSGFIDIACEEAKGIVVVELKVGTADSRAIGQILDYIGDLQEEEGGKPRRGILVPYDFDQRSKSAPVWFCGQPLFPVS